MAQILRIPGVDASNIVAIANAFLVSHETKVSPTRLGIEAKKDPNLIIHLRNGREPRKATVDAIVRVIECYSPGFCAKFMADVRLVIDMVDAGVEQTITKVRDKT